MTKRDRIRSWIRLWKTWDKPRFHSYITEINSKHQSSFLFSFQVELMLLLAILNGLKSFRWYFLMFANSWIYCKFKFYWYVKKFSFDYLLASRYISTQPFSTICKHYCEIISQENIHNVWNVMSIVSEQDWGGCMWE